MGGGACRRRASPLAPRSRQLHRPCRTTSAGAWRPRRRPPDQRSVSAPTVACRRPFGPRPAVCSWQRRRCTEPNRSRMPCRQRRRRRSPPMIASTQRHWRRQRRGPHRWSSRRWPRVGDRCRRRRDCCGPMSTPASWRTSGSLSWLVPVTPAKAAWRLGRRRTLFPCRMSRIASRCPTSSRRFAANRRCLAMAPGFDSKCSRHSSTMSRTSKRHPCRPFRSSFPCLCPCRGMALALAHPPARADPPSSG
mmetsp:Transcript_36540/g.105247  ORF Transcript_36540/g.105247 Transcript_36540/m.105247 type:complete len:249 (+) Transcript_36540:272-1018(+)